MRSGSILRNRGSSMSGKTTCILLRYLLRRRRADHHRAYGRLQDNLDAVPNILLRSYLQCGFFGELDQCAKVGRQSVEDLQARSGVQGVTALEGIERDLHRFGFRTMAQTGSQVWILQHGVEAFPDEYSRVGNDHGLAADDDGIRRDIAETL